MVLESAEQAGRRPTDVLPRRWVLFIFIVAFAVRATAACAVQRIADNRGTLCLFDDANIYWYLAGELKTGHAYRVFQFSVPHASLRMPGYPMMLAALRVVCFDVRLLIRLIQAGINAASILLLMAVVRELIRNSQTTLVVHAHAAALATGWIAAFEPWSAGMSVLLLSESLFMPLIIWSLAGFATLWCGLGRALSVRRHLMAIVSTGLANGLVVAMRPSWALFPPIVIVALVLSGRQPYRWAALRAGLLALVVTALVLSPWWYRNARVYGRFVPTALWLGASLYDGLNPDATGASDMRFLERPEFRDLDEVIQDRVLRDKALEFARNHPARTLKLAAIKAARFWSPWPNADEISALPLRIISGLVTLPLYALIFWGAWRCHGDARTLVLLLGPVVYFAAVHMAFVGSMRYRIPALVPALGLAGVAAADIAALLRGARNAMRGGAKP